MLSRYRLVPRTLQSGALNRELIVGSPATECFSAQRLTVRAASEDGSGDRLAIGIILDGTGYGYDHSIWGGEIFIGNYIINILYNISE